MATSSARPRSASRSARSARDRRGGHDASRRPAEVAPGTKSGSQPAEEPEKAHKPKAAAKAGRPHKARKPAAARKATRATKASATRASGRPKKPGGATKSGGGDGLDLSLPKPAKALAKAAAPGGSGLARKAAWKLAKMAAGRMVSSGAKSLTEMSEGGLASAAQAVGSVRATAIAATSTSVEIDGRGRPPIQASVDVAVPTWVAWDEWIQLEWLPEGVDAAVDIERGDDGELTGCLRGDRGADWSARILDEREDESFAWESDEGSDCAGLITFHELGERLTRIELTLDVHPVSLRQAAALAARGADRRASADLRRFKARLELINPDLYTDSETDE